MGSIHPRLQATLQAVRPGARVAVLVRTRHPVTGTTLRDAHAAGAGTVSYVSTTTNLYATTADAATAQRLAALPETIEVLPDDPTQQAP